MCLRFTQKKFFLRLSLCVAVITLGGRFAARIVPENVPTVSVGSGLATCFQAHVENLLAFDPYMQSLKSAGRSTNEIENRWQEQVWDTILHTYALFPSWSDMRWNIPQYGRGLASDLSVVQALAVSSLYPSTSAHATPLAPFQSSHSPVHISHVHHRLDRLRGLQYLVSFAPRDGEGSGSAYSMLIRKSLDTSECRVALSECHVIRTVHIILPYSRREQRLRLFVQNFLLLRTQYSERVELIVSVVRTYLEDIRVVRSLIDELLVDQRYQGVLSSIRIHENNGDVEGKFSRGVAVREASKLVRGANSVVFHCDVDMLILPTFMDRCRQNSVLGLQVYFPVFYSLYPYANAEPKIAERNGFWRKTSFGMTCMCKGDFEMVGAYENAETQFHGWGSEDVYQFEKVRNTSALVAFRAVEPALIHRWHGKTCDVETKGYVDCMKTNFMTMGHPLHIGKLLLESLTDVKEFFRKLQQM